MASEASACGTMKPASGVAWPLQSTIGCTARPGWNCAEEPTVATTVENAPQSSSAVSAVIMVS
jgi:hypothetical protein